MLRILLSGIFLCMALCPLRGPNYTGSVIESSGPHGFEYVLMKNDPKDSVHNSTDTLQRPILFGQPVNLNQAVQQAIIDIPGIGPKKAAAIVDYREKNGPFRDVEELVLVSGIGSKTVEKIQSYIIVD